MQTLITVGISLIIMLTSVFGIYQYAPLSWLETSQPQTFGNTTITTISSATKISDLATILPNNFNALNAGKIEISTTTLPLITTLGGLTTAGSLATVGALASGSLTTGFTAVNVAQGGTGSTTLSQYQILLGNGTSLTTPSGWGTNGQFLTSAGAGALPSWTTSSVDLAINYDWTGFHSFTNASTTNASTTLLSLDTLWLDGTEIPTISQVASTSVWSADGTWTKPTGAKRVFVQVWGAGGSGGAACAAGSNDKAGGGGGGAYEEKWFVISDLGATETITVGTGGAAQSTNIDGTAGESSTFGASATLITAYGGGFGEGVGDGDGAGGGGAGQLAAGGNGAGGTGGTAGSLGTPFSGAGGNTGAAGSNGTLGAGGGGAGAFAGGKSVLAGGGGGGASAAAEGIGGTSKLGGAGGAGLGAASGNAVSGSIPGGGGGARSHTAGCTGNSGAGGDGQVIVTTFF